MTEESIDLRSLVAGVMASPEVRDAIWLAEGRKLGGPHAFLVRMREPDLEFEWSEADERALGVVTWRAERGNLLSGRVFEGDTRRPDPPMVLEALEAFPVKSGTSFEVSKPWRPGDDPLKLGELRAAPVVGQKIVTEDDPPAHQPDVPRYSALWAYPTTAILPPVDTMTRAELAEARASERTSKAWRPTDDPQSLGALRAAPVLIPKFSTTEPMPAWTE